MEKHYFKNNSFLSSIDMTLHDNEYEMVQYSNSPLKVTKDFHGCFRITIMIPIVLFHPMQRVDSLEKTLMLGGIGGRRRRG